MYKYLNILNSQPVQHSARVFIHVWLHEDGCGLEPKHVAAVKSVGIKTMCARQLDGKCTILKLVTCRNVPEDVRYMSRGDAPYVRGQPEIVCGPPKNPIFSSHSVVRDKC